MNKDVAQHRAGGFCGHLLHPRPGRASLAVLAAALAGIGGCGGPAAPGDGLPGNDAETTEPAAPGAAAAAAGYVGGAACLDCHADAAAAWQGSHHDLAMQVADEATVLGDFDDASLAHDGITSRFFRRDGGYWIRTDGADGELADFRVTHTFGIEPLQQYLVELPGGRFQIPAVAWDTRTAADGGQRWFDVHPDEDIGHSDPLHWTGVFQSWNTSCAGCHSTNLVKNYDPATDTFATTYSSVDVDCEACHGPGSLHVADPEAHSLLLAADGAQWIFPPGESIAERVPARTEHTEIETCAQCHSRRSQLADRFEPGTPLLHAFRPQLLEDGIYHADGQILDEVYVYGSFLQSKMYAAGVSCSDCHEPHSNRLKAEGNGVCAQCHLASSYETAEHHRHEPGASGSACVDCHMPSKTYMVVDPRRDHSFRVPRPDLSAAIGVPNACTGCHGGETDEWAAGIVADCYPQGRSGDAHYGEAIDAGRNWLTDRNEALMSLVDEPTHPDIVRATGIQLLARQLDSRAIPLIESALARGDAPLLQMAALDALAAFPAELQIELARPLLTHDSLTLRISAARQLAPLRLELPQSRRGALDAALDEYRAVQAFNGDRPEGWVNLAGLQIDLGEFGAAETSLETAIERYPYFAASYLNLADLYRRSGRDAQSEALLSAATDANPDDPAGWLALGLAQVRAGRSEDALGALRKAVAVAPDDPYFAYVLGIALNSTDGTAAAIDVLEDAHERFPGYRDITFALATMSRDTGDVEAAQGYARHLLEASPGDPAALSLLRELEGVAPGF